MSGPERRRRRSDRPTNHRGGGLFLQYCTNSLVAFCAAGSSRVGFRGSAPNGMMPRPAFDSTTFRQTENLPAEDGGGSSGREGPIPFTLAGPGAGFLLGPSQAGRRRREGSQLACLPPAPPHATSPSSGPPPLTLGGACFARPAFRFEHVATRHPAAARLGHFDSFLAPTIVVPKHHAWQARGARDGEQRPRWRAPNSQQGAAFWYGREA